MTTPLLEINDLVVSYQTAKGLVHAVNNVSLEVHPGQITAIVGESGSGKSTTAQAVIGLLADNAEVDSGRISFNGRSLVGLNAREWKNVRGTKIGLIPQDPNNSLNPVKTIGASVGEGLAIHKRGTAAERKKKVIELLERVGIDNPEVRYDQYPHELSGGMKQRALIAAAIALEPELIIADEPTSALDVTVQKIILDLLEDMQRELGMGILFITHDLAVAGDRADRIVVMQKGEVRESGYAASVLTDPQHEYSKKLLADAPSLTIGEIPTRVPAVDPEVAQAKGPLLVVDKFRKEHQRGKEGAFVAANDISFEVLPGTTHAIVGESGSGKTTLGRAIAMFNTPTSGSISVSGKDITNLSKAQQRELRQQIQLVYQNPYSSLDPRQTIGSTIAEPLRNFTKVSKQEADEKVAHYLELVALDPALATRRPRELSGGQRQRVAIARAMILEPELVVFDEAVSALDVTVQAQILRLLDDLQRELGLTYVFISHDLAVVREISDTVSVMSRGNQVELGKTAEVFNNPQTDFTRRLIDAIPGSRYRGGELNLGL
ncbi:ABC-type putative dipeptide/oligopeptide transporter, ATPase subunit [Corynebacterium glutamicum MB001]|uniref:ABC-type transporter, duplicated ATPase component n=1 Tax=Corynebacterium glutamicum (strain ATCC 13032 / DSM 20300 / JCM 1318 / BCRC 11384 / CCUG 27702 / LMG 3730 / NBRC 12168 / NCIMB 10025 / NRRL B-2784 / 534) TaxID=196627 RepID=Q8NMX7_CORGL|nr:ABC transporter ATP-binding protein [Corynebacterium glutamicum]AGT06161.1 ABC-type putative dipeptide/oligopeptide transporter, ATPase subunit [Corynebacterium glutamicum MB001]ARV63547.1 ABC transporter ATP-binding protein [Corynebacterium glutamicum]AUI01853.1 ABC transporter ATP-binding protein [Corynebacterium glutamicum]AUI02671.1 ABC transporter ATP-binding protein [Corynebacterium glutamicum]MBA4570696.1 ABC transporter ATP-binding protein [Corynebacterium glutamicum]